MDDDLFTQIEVGESFSCLPVLEQAEKENE